MPIGGGECDVAAIAVTHDDHGPVGPGGGTNDFDQVGDLLPALIVAPVVTALVMSVRG